MSEQFWLSNKHMEMLSPFFPRSRRKTRVDNQRVLKQLLKRWLQTLPSRLA